jgi:hypothetical protein
MATRPGLNKALTTSQVDFIDFVLERYVATGVEELDDERLPDLIKLKYQALQDGITALRHRGSQRSLHWFPTILLSNWLVTHRSTAPFCVVQNSNSQKGNEITHSSQK